MAALLLPSRRIVPPAGAIVRGNSPIVRDLRHAWVFNESRWDALDLLGPWRPSSSTAPAKTFDRFDGISAVGGAGNSITGLSNASVWLTTGPCTVLVHLRQVGSAGGYPCFSVGTPGGEGTGEFHAYVPYGPDGNTYWRYGDATGISVADANDTTRRKVYGFTAGGALGQQIWLNGALLASNGATTTRTNSTSPLYLHDSSGQAKTIFSFWVFHRQLHQSELAWLTREENLYAELLAAPREPRRTYIGQPSATGIPVLSAATAVNITSSAATPRVTLTF